MPFVTGFLTAAGRHGRLCGNAVAKDGSLLFSDDRNGVIYRVSYAGDRPAAAPVPPKTPAVPMPVGAGRDVADRHRVPRDED